MGLGVGVLGAEGGAEGVDLGEGHGEGLALQLAGDGQGSLLAEEVLIPLARVLGIKGGHGEGVARALGVVAGDQGRVDVQVAAILEVGVDGHGSHAAHAEHSLEQAGTGAQIADLAQELDGVALGLQGVILGAVALQDDLGGLHLGGGGILIGRNHGALHGDGRAHAQGLDLLKARDVVIINDLRVLEAQAIEEVDEAHVLLLAVVADPAAQGDGLTLQLAQAILEFKGGNDAHGNIPPIEG